MANCRQVLGAFARQTKPRNTTICRCSSSRPRHASTTAVPLESDEKHVPAWRPYQIPPSNQSPERRRLEDLRLELKEKPFSSFLTDNYSREHNYLRISVTERCNLRCVYCMPEEGIDLSPPEQNLTSPEIVYLSELFVKQGVTKIRLTGGEPTVRKDIVDLMRQIGGLRKQGLKELCITTNGISLHRKLDRMVESGLTGVNLSLDTLDPFQFTLMTRRNGHDAVMKSIARILELNKLGAGIKLKINCVVMKGLNEREILPFVELGREKDIEVRFIEYMPFDGNKWSENKMVSYKEMLALIQKEYPDIHPVKDHVNDTSKTYKIPGFVGRIGFITSMTHNFCGTCNRLRITSDGNLKVCLFGNAEVSLRDVLREYNSGKPFSSEEIDALHELETGLQTEPGHIGSLKAVTEHESRLLNIIGAAVKRKKEKHADVTSALFHPPYTDWITQLGKAVTWNCSPNRSNKAPRHLTAGQYATNTLQQVRVYSTTPPPIRNLPHRRTRRGALDRNNRARWLTTGKHHPKSESNKSSRLTHLNERGEAHMVDISHKSPTKRIATATSTLLFSQPQTYATLQNATSKKGDAIAVARIAAIQAAKKTADLIPLAHPSLLITSIEVDISSFDGKEQRFTVKKQDGSSQGSTLMSDHGGVTVAAKVACEGKTGIEMEAIVAATIGTATLYDMLKGVDKGMSIMNTRVIEKKGGKSGDWTWDESTNRLVQSQPLHDATNRSDGTPSSDLAHSTNTSNHELILSKPSSPNDVDEWNSGLAAEFSLPLNISPKEVPRESSHTPHTETSKSRFIQRTQMKTAQGGVRMFSIYARNLLQPPTDIARLSESSSITTPSAENTPSDPKILKYKLAPTSKEVAAYHHNLKASSPVKSKATTEQDEPVLNTIRDVVETPKKHSTKFSAKSYKMSRKLISTDKEANLPPRLKLLRPTTTTSADERPTLKPKPLKIVHYSLKSQDPRTHKVESYAIDPRVSKSFSTPRPTPESSIEMRSVSVSATNNDNSTEIRTAPAPLTITPYLSTGPADTRTAGSRQPSLITKYRSSVPTSIRKIQSTTGLPPEVQTTQAPSAAEHQYLGPVGPKTSTLPQSTQKVSGRYEMRTVKLEQSIARQEEVANRNADEEEVQSIRALIGSDSRDGDDDTDMDVDIDMDMDMDTEILESIGQIRMAEDEDARRDQADGNAMRPVLTTYPRDKDM